MKHIHKTKEPQSLSELKTVTQKNQLKVTFETLPANVIYDLVHTLLYEQGALCCYCQNEVSAETAHLIPFIHAQDEILNYTNFFLSCNHSNHLPPDQQHCYIKKGMNLIPKFMSDDECANLFRYNTLGEILPSGTHRTVRKCKDNYDSLTPVQQSILSSIDVLNLNADRLKDLRKMILSQITTNFKKSTKTHIQQAMEHYGKRDKTGKYTRFTEVIIYYLGVM